MLLRHNWRVYQYRVKILGINYIIIVEIGPRTILMKLTSNFSFKFDMTDDRPASQSIFALEFDEDIKGLGFDCEIVYF